MNDQLPPPVTPHPDPAQGTRILIDGRPFVFDTYRGWVIPVKPWATWKVVVLTVAAVIGFTVATALFGLIP